ncbi:hypothetical protein F0562_021378 [Nyssa sinensis]|uniref:Uncharacterized protein n=1 Tax=Nyssa sinensis TaxID=561372 RepID=A0A5J5BMX4_9ASTE|nr:hypothetical protein F0562_021378 [Nyssa sinensis]
MWRKNTFPENQDSDQSISEEEDLASDWPEICISLGGPAEKKGGIQIQSQFEILRDTCDQKQTCFSIEDDVEIPIFHNEGDFFHSPRKASMCNFDEKNISDDEENNLFSTSGAKDFHNVSLLNIEGENQDGACTWSEVTKEAEALVHLNENAGCPSSHSVFSKVNRSCKGGRGKVKPKFSFRFQSHRKDLSWPVNSKDGNDNSYKALPLPGELETTDHGTMQHSMAELLENFQGKKIEQSEIHGPPAEVGVGHNYAERSVVELLDGYQEKDGMLKGNSKMYGKTKGRRVQLVVKRNTSPLGYRNMDGDDPLEALDNGPSSDDEAGVQNLQLLIPESPRKTMADQFQEALGAASMNNQGPLFALPGQSRPEKERDMVFIKRLQMGGSSNDESSSIDVKILSRSLEAKLTVCCCSFSGDKESSHWAESRLMTKENGERTLKIIFSSRVCGDVELEVGNMIRIHPPWKEVQVMGKDEIMILSIYFSVILT